MSGLDRLPPDQRAVLHLILAQGRGYAELARMLKIDVSAVRSRAHAGLDALAGSGEAPDDARRAQIADYLLGQQDDGARLVTLLDLGESTIACRWATALREQLLPLAHEPLPEVPEAVATNGAMAAAALTAPISSPSSPQPTRIAPPPAAAVSSETPVPPAIEPSPPPTAPHMPTSATPRPSRRGGAILLAAAAALAVAVVLAIVLIGGDGNDAATTSGTSTAPTQSTPTQSSTTGAPATGDILAQVNLLATPAGGQAAGLGFVQRVNGKLAIAIQADKLPANGTQDIYAAWVSGSSGTKLLGFVPNQVKANGTFTVSAALPPNARQYDTVLITRESAAGGAIPTQPGVAIMRGALRLPS